MTTPINLQEFLLTRMNVEYIDGKKNDTSQIKLVFSFEARANQENPNLFKMTLGVTSEPADESDGIKLDTLIDGFFELNETILDPAQKQYYVFVNGATILYGILRGQVALFSNNFPCGKFCLPTVVMQEEVKKFFALQKTQKSSESTPKRVRVKKSTAKNKK